MEKKRREMIGLSVILVLALVSVSNATLSMNLSGSSMDIGGTAIVITIHSDLSEETTWGVYLDPTTLYSTYAELNTATIIRPNAGNSSTVTGADPGAGHDYTSAGKQANAPIADTDWSTVQFVGKVVGDYDVILTDGGSGGNVLLRESINVVPEPATIALLGLGGMFLLRRRR